MIFFNFIQRFNMCCIESRGTHMLLFVSQILKFYVPVFKFCWITNRPICATTQ